MRGVGERLRKMTPGVQSVLLPGDYTLTFVKEGYVDGGPVPVTVTEGDTTTVNPVVLQKEEVSTGAAVYLPAVQSSSTVQAGGSSVRGNAMEKGLFLPAIVR